MGGPGGRLEQRTLASVASIQMVEHQETSVQSQGHPLQRYTQTSTSVIVKVKLPIELMAAKCRIPGLEDMLSWEVHRIILLLSSLYLRVCVRVYVCAPSSSQRSPGTNVVRTNTVRSRKSVLFVIAADQTDASGGEQQLGLQLCGRPADSRPDPSADHSPG